MNKYGLVFAIALPAMLGVEAIAQVCGPAYSVQSQTYFEEQYETRYRINYEITYEDQEITSYRLVPRVREEIRKVAKPVVETSTVEEKYTVLRPVVKTEMVDQSYDETTYVTETSEREETYTSYMPVTETHYQTQQYVVQKPVVETQYQTQQYTTYQPITTYQNAVVDMGQYVAQQYYQPGDTRYGLKWLSGGWQSDPMGVSGYRRGGLGWVPYTSQGSMSYQTQYQANPVQIAVPQTSLMPQTQQIQVPVQVTHMQNEIVQQQVPYNLTRMQAVQQVRKVPYSVNKPVTRRIERQVPVEKIEYVEQEMVRPRTVERTSIQYVEERVPVHYMEREAVTSIVKVPRRVAKTEPYVVRKVVARVVPSPVILSYNDPYSAAMYYGQNSMQSFPASERVIFGAPRPVDSSSSTEPNKQSVKKIETEDPATNSSNGSSNSNVENENSASEAETTTNQPENIPPPKEDLELSPPEAPHT
ncbi:MAG: hypothetical protein KDB03_06535 [Planctomycetales bacterium]|nr:hypothetical protein [Planctomycetales bacterium]